MVIFNKTSKWLFILLMGLCVFANVMVILEQGFNTNTAFNLIDLIVLSIAFGIPVLGKFEGKLKKISITFMYISLGLQFIDLMNNFRLGKLVVFFLYGLII